jgi:hypothetical protein
MGAWKMPVIWHLFALDIKKQAKMLQ